MKKWIQLTEFNTVIKLSLSIDVDCIITYGPHPGNGIYTQIRTNAGHTIIVEESLSTVQLRIKEAK